MKPQDIDARIARQLRRLRPAFRGRLAALDLSKRLQRMQLRGLAGELLEDIEHFQQFGFTSAPPEGSELVVIPIGGKTSQCIVVACENGRYRFRLQQPGEAALYNKDGDYVWIRDGRIVEIKAQQKVKVDAPAAEFTGDVTIAGNLTVTGNITGASVADAYGSMQQMRVVYNGHTHHENNAVNGNTNTPNQQMAVA